MSEQQYREINFRAGTLERIAQANAIAREWRAQGYDLTLRQLYYQFVARALIPNKQTEYDNLGSIINDARYAGLFDWDYITDRTRNVRGGDGSMTDPNEAINEYYFSLARWKGQPERVEVWVEKDALVGIIGQAAAPWRTPYFSCRGYTSSSELKVAANRIEDYLDDDVDTVTIIHLGDHDPSGVDMTRDITDRLQEFLRGDGYNVDDLEIQRIALNMDQVRTYNPPPNPAKLTDSRAADYIARFGRESWELDALNPSVLDNLIQTTIRSHLDIGQWDAQVELEAKGRATLKGVREHYPDVVEFLRDRDLIPPADDLAEDQVEANDADD